MSRWESDRRLWSVSHDPSSGPDHLDATGAPPNELVELRKKLPADCSRYIPPELAGGITGSSSWPRGMKSETQPRLMRLIAEVPAWELEAGTKIAAVG